MSRCLDIAESACSYLTVQIQPFSQHYYFYVSLVRYQHSHFIFVSTVFFNFLMVLGILNIAQYLKYENRNKKDSVPTDRPREKGKYRGGDRQIMGIKREKTD